MSRNREIVGLMAVPLLRDAIDAMSDLGGTAISLMKARIPSGAAEQRGTEYSGRAMRTPVR